MLTLPPLFFLLQPLLSIYMNAGISHTQETHINADNMSFSCKSDLFAVVSC